MNARGFTLIEIVVVLFIMGVVLAMGAVLTRGVTAAAQRNISTAALERADLALRGYVQLMRRLPCPADGALAESNAQAGREQRGASGTCTNNEARGVLPWVTLGMSANDALDGYAVRLTYRVAPELTANEALRFSDCDSAGAAAVAVGSPGGCNTVCANPSTANMPIVCTAIASVIAGKGLRVQNAASPPLVLADPAATPPTGAAYIVLSHGPNHYGGYGTSGVVQDAVSTPVAGEAQNIASNALMPYYVDDPSMDDILSRPTVMAVVTRAGLGPLPHTSP